MKKRMLMAAVAATVLMLSCKKDKEEEPNDGILYGPEVPVGNGNARSFLNRTITITR